MGGFYRLHNGQAEDVGIDINGLSCTGGLQDTAFRATASDDRRRLSLRYSLGTYAVSEIYDIHDLFNIRRIEGKVRNGAPDNPDDYEWRDIVYPIVRSDAEDGTTNAWRIYDQTPAGATIENIQDNTINSRVIELTGTGRRNGFALGWIRGARAWDERERTNLSWRMNFDDRFVIYVHLSTSKGERYLIYSAIDNNIGRDGQYIYIGLGANMRDGRWHNIYRDIAEDLETYEADNTLIAINAFLVRGSGRIDKVSSDKCAKDHFEW